MRKRIPSGDDGQVLAPFIILVMVLLLVLAVRVFLPLGQATDQRASSRSAADAAALAAAEHIKEQLPGVIEDSAKSAKGRDDLTDLLDDLGGNFGYDQASDYADRNGSDLVEYHFIRSTGEVETRVRNVDAAVDGEHAESVARADLGIRLGACRLPDKPAPTTTPPLDPTGPDDGSEDPEEPPADTELALTCGDLKLNFTMDGKTGRPKLADVDDLKDQLGDLQPRLTL